MNGRKPRIDSEELIAAERTVTKRLASADPPIDVDFAANAVVTNVFRVATAARTYVERVVLSKDNLSFTAFTVLWVLWIWGEQEFRHVAGEAGITKGTLTGVLTTLERRGLAERRPHASDRRLVLVAATDDGERLMERLFPLVNQEETRIVAGLSDDEPGELAHLLRELVRRIDRLSSDGEDE